MKKRTRLLASLMVVALGIGTFAGCNKSTQPKVADQTEVKDETPITIDWMPQNDQPVNPESHVIKELEKKLNVKFNFIYMDRSKEIELLNMRVVAGEIPDVMRLTEDRFRAYIDQGVLADIPEETIKKKAPKLYDLELKYGGALAWQFAKGTNGKIYGLPSLNPNGAGNFVPLWRDDWLKNVGIAKMPETLKDAEDAFYKFANNDPDKNGKKDTYALSNTGMSVVFGAYGGIPYFSQGGGLGFTWTIVNGKAVATAVMPEMKEALTLLNKWYKDGIIDPEFISGENKGGKWSLNVTFQNGKIGYSCPALGYGIRKVLYPGNVPSQNYTDFMKLQPNGSYDYGKPLVGPNGKSGTEKWGTFPGVYVVLGKQVAKDTKKLEKILEVNEKVASDEDINYTSLFGVKGVDWKLNAEGILEKMGDSLDANKGAALGIGTNGIGYLGETNFDGREKTSSAIGSAFTKSTYFGDNYSNPVWGSLPSYPTLKPAVEKKIRESYILFVAGDKKISEFDAFVADLNKSGLEQLTKEANEWYSKYSKK